MSGRILFTLKRSRGELWSDALTDSVAYVTILEPSAANADATIVGVSRRHPQATARARAARRRQPPVTSYQPGGGANALKGGCA